LQESVQARIERALGGNYTLEENPTLGIARVSGVKARDALARLAEAGVEARPHYVYFAGPSYFGTPSFVGNPSLFGNPSFFGNPSYFGNPQVNTAEPVPEPKPAWPERTDRKARPVVAVLDTGLETVDGKEPRHPVLKGHAVVHSPWTTGPDVTVPV